VSPEDADETPERPAAGEPSPDGLDLARALTRANATTGEPAQRRRATSRPKKRPGDPAHPDDRDPQTLDATVSRLVADHGWELDLRMHGVFGRWAQIVGDEVAAHSTPETFTEGKLVVRTDSTAWATQLTLLAATLIQRLNEELGHGTVTLIDVVGPHGPTWKKGPRSVPGRGPRDTYG
jgi:predicted nucleic acid-binding Zn ribbon protein